MSKRMTAVTLSKHSSPRRLGAWAAPLVALSLGACGIDRSATGAAGLPAADYTATHPIKFAEAAVTMDVFPGAGKMDRATDMRLREFAGNHRDEGIGQIEALLPAGAINEQALRAALPAIRKSLAAGGAKGNIGIGTYPADPRDGASPIRLAYRALKAKVAGRCGEWPADLASASTLEGWQNRPYWNFGCAYQTAFATQVADPRDFAAPRAEAPADVEMRRLRIEKVRAGSDPGATWKTTNSSIGSVGG